MLYIETKYNLFSTSCFCCKNTNKSLVSQRFFPNRVRNFPNQNLPTFVSALIFRLFAIINPIPGQEEENANFLLNCGAAVRLYDADNTKPFLDSVLSDKTRVENIKSMQKHIAKPDSTRDIVDIILKSI